MGPFNQASRGFEYLIVLTDYYSKWPEALATSSTNTKVIIDFLRSKFATGDYQYPLLQIMAHNL